MSHFRAVDRDTAYLLPPSVDEWLPKDHLARFVVEILDQLDFSGLLSQYRGSGSQAYHPQMLAALLIYGYATGTHSSRRIEQACYDSIAFRFIAANTHPDHDTLCAFRRRFLKELEALEKIERVKVSPGDVILLYTGRWKRRAALGPWPNSTGFAGYHADVAYFLKERGVSFIGCDGPNDVSPTGLPPEVANPLHRLALVAMGVSIFDNLDFERAAEEAKRLNRYEFLFMAAPLRIEMGTGSPLNPLAVF